VTPTPDLCDRYGDRVQVAEPLFRDFGGRGAFAGEIETVRVVEDNALVRRVLEDVGRGRVLVVDGQGSRRCALLGGRLAGLAAANGWAGIVVNGCVRDVAELAAAALGVKALAACPRPPGKTGAGERGVPVTFAGITFTPGHRVWGDEDGLVVAAMVLTLD
jgi:regulator of ribonuclease activity A